MNYCPFCGGKRPSVCLCTNELNLADLRAKLSTAHHIEIIFRFTAYEFHKYQAIESKLCEDAAPDVTKPNIRASVGGNSLPIGMHGVVTLYKEKRPLDVGDILNAHRSLASFDAVPSGAIIHQGEV